MRKGTKAKNINNISHPFSHLCILLIVVFVLIFLNACSEEETIMGSDEMQIHVVGTITYKANGSPAENVEVQFLNGIYQVLKTTVTDQDGKYFISYYGKCRTIDQKTTYKVRARSTDGYYPDWPNIYTLQCTSNTQTFNFQLIPKP
ncbi:MAG: carboxypeptidase-like regulatory domain-containing protein [Candidatus Hodarchaeales archaeon]|jgi:5-hydroxyisourate hydrolase-like protein (transthyretin family)